MSEIIRMMFIVLVAVMGMNMNMDISTNARSTSYLKEDLNTAVHDAGMELNEEELSNGNIIIERVEALDTFKESLELNTGMDEEDYIINSFQIYDDSNASFPEPITYAPENFEHNQTFTSPSVIAIVETETDSYFKGRENTIRQVASYSYEPNTSNDSAVASLSTVSVQGNNLESPVAASGMRWIVPHTTRVSSHFNPARMHPIFGEVKAHTGMDVAAAGINNKPTVAAKDGTVSFSGSVSGYGNMVIISHGAGLETRYAHLNNRLVESGEKVTSGQPVGLIGSTGNSTGPHLHFETRVNGKPYDPYPMFKGVVN